MKQSVIKLSAAFFILAALTCVRTAAGTITVKGSDTLVILAHEWANVYMASHPSVKIEVSGGGSGVGIAALQNQGTDIADASRTMKRDEKEKFIMKFNAPPVEYRVAVDGLSVYVNKASKVKELDLDQLSGIFTGTITNWKEVGGDDAPIKIYSRENSSGTYEFFKALVLKGKDFAATAQTMQGTAQLLESVNQDVHGIGYGGAGYGVGAAVLAIKKDANSPAILPTEETVLNQTYPIWRYLYNYVNPEADKGEIHDYINWIRSDEGQKIVKEQAYYPLPKDQRSK
jgi:phosphate transport system substrate-binding protein